MANCDDFLSLGDVILNRMQGGNFYIVVGEMLNNRVIIWWCGGSGEREGFSSSQKDIFHSVETKF